MTNQGAKSSVIENTNADTSVGLDPKPNFMIAR